MTIAFRRRRLASGMFLAAVVLATVGVGPARGQTSAPAGPAEAAKAEEKKPSLWDEFKLFSYVEMGGTINLHGQSRGVPGSTSGGDTNLLRLYDLYEGYTFNMAEFSIKRDPNEAFPFGMGLTLTAGMDAQKNHSIGILRDDDDVFPFRNTPYFDIQEAYVSGRIPLLNGPVLKVGKFVTHLGYEVIESPNNLNYSRGLLFTLAVPLTTTGGLVSYQFTDWLSAQAGVVLGWDRSNTDNSGPSGTGQIAVTPVKDLSTALNFIVGPEISGDKNPIRWVVDLTATYTGLRGWTFGANFDYGWQANDVFLTSQGLGDRSAAWYGLAGYVAYDFLERFRAAVRGEWFRDADGVRTATTADGVDLFSATGTVQAHIWKGLYARAEYRHDQATEKVFGFDSRTGLFADKSQDTISLSIFYKFF